MFCIIKVGVYSEILPISCTSNANEVRGTGAAQLNLHYCDAYLCDGNITNMRAGTLGSCVLTL